MSNKQYIEADLYDGMVIEYSSRYIWKTELGHIISEGYGTPYPGYNAIRILGHLNRGTCKHIAPEMHEPIIFI